MTTQKIDWVALFLCTDDFDRRAALLQVRGEWDFEQSDYRSWPGFCQATVIGRLKEGESPWDVVRRKTDEKLGSAVADHIFGRRPPYDPPRYNVHELSVINGMASYAVLVNRIKGENILWSKGALHFSSGGMRLVRFSQVPEIRLNIDFNRQIGVLDRSIAMFPDEKQALIAAFSAVVNDTGLPLAPETVVVRTSGGCGLERPR